MDVPTPPDLTNRAVPDQFDADEPISDQALRREELEAILGRGAWQEGFDEWARYTDLTEADVELAERLGLFRALDFYWDGDAAKLRYVVPEVPESWGEQAGEEHADRVTLQEELDDLGRTVADTIALDYVDWGDGEDLVWGVDTFGQVPTDGE